MDVGMLCPCCYDRSFKKKDSFEVCPICGWIDDLSQRKDPDFAGGANDFSLNVSKVKWEAKKSIAAANLYQSF